ncbi:4-coumarate--CoA ligase-like [Schistocerca piceifrons]|uniref:4-coumarate--CoA ligase-like n=1 Tax=Schistocerca piceifrons TaxID=274613 RepID=UPI001F5E53B7|nr:4-coumarate--CoA ligase-like [Schistocerca piceifrons]
MSAAMLARGLCRFLGYTPPVRTRATPAAALSVSRSLATPTTTAAAAPGVLRSPYPDVDIPDVPFYEYAWMHLDRYPDRVAMECAVTGRRYTYSQLRTASRRFAAALQKAGLGPGHVLFVLLPNCPEFLAIILGANEAGVSIATCNPAYTTGEMSRQLRDCRPSAAVTTPELAPSLSSAFQEARLEPPQLLVTVGVAYSSTQPTSGATPEGAADFVQLVGDASLDGALRPQRTGRDHLFLLPYSSGTTGLPKGVMLSNRNLVANVQQTAYPRVQVLDVDASGVCEPGNVVPVVLPMYHLYALALIMLQKVCAGATMVCMPKFEPALFLDVLAKHKATLLYLVPPMVLFLAGNPSVKKSHLETVRRAISSAAPVGEKDIARFFERAPAGLKFFQTYGMTETSPTTILPDRDVESYTTVGKPVPNTLIKVVSTDTSEVLGPNQPGEIVVKGPQVMLGYYNNPKATAETIRGDGWIHTGDIGYYDADSNFYIVDRLKELIKVKGFSVAPAELEEILRSHPSIEEAAVVGVRHDRLGEAPKAFVVPKKGAQGSLRPEDVLQFVEGKVVEYKRLAGGVEFVDAIPKNPSGKLLRRVLRQQAQ